MSRLKQERDEQGRLYADGYTVGIEVGNAISSRRIQVFAQDPTTLEMAFNMFCPEAEEQQPCNPDDIQKCRLLDIADEEANRATFEAAGYSDDDLQREAFVAGWKRAREATR